MGMNKKTLIKAMKFLMWKPKLQTISIEDKVYYIDIYLK